MPDRVFRSDKRRIFVSSPIDDGLQRYTLDDANAHYLTRVLRLKATTQVDVADGTGRLLQGDLQQDGDTWTLHNLRVIHQEPADPRRIVAAALIKPDRWEWMLEKAAEIGATEIQPVTAQRSVVQIPAAKLSKRLERWERILEGSSRQCERLSPVRIHPPRTLADTLENAHATTCLMLDEDVPKRAWPTLDLAQPITLFVGPEGGWTDEERTQLHAANALSCGLGKNLLRAETAAVSALTILRALDHGLL